MVTTTGFIQRLTLLSNGQTVCVWVGNEPKSVETLFLTMTSSDSQSVLNYKRTIVGLLAETQLSGRQIDIEHSEQSAEIIRVGTHEQVVSANPVQLDAIEVTQAIQDLSHSVPLSAGKRTVVRLYLSRYAASSFSLIVKGEIKLRRSPNEAPLTVASVKPVAVIPGLAGNIAEKRGDVNLSLNFVLPPNYTTAGPLTIQVSKIIEAQNTGEVFSVGGEQQLTVRFHPVPPLRIRVLGMRYKYKNPGETSTKTYAPTNIDFNAFLSWLARAYPAGQVISSTAVIDAKPTAPFVADDINAQLAAIRAIDMSSGGDSLTHYYGMVSDGGFRMRGRAADIPPTPRPDTVASGPAGPPGPYFQSGWDTDSSYGDWYGGHELGHTFGRKHPGFCGESKDDLDNYPFDNGQLANSERSFIGFDVGDPANEMPMWAMRGTQWHDVMTYCDHQWVSVYTYLGIRRRLFDENTPVAGSTGGGVLAMAPITALAASLAGPDQPEPRSSQDRLPMSDSGMGSSKTMISVVATVNLTKKQGQIKYVNPVSEDLTSPVALNSTTLLRVKNSAGQVVSQHPVLVQLHSELHAHDDREGIIAAVIPVSADTGSIELVLEGQQVVDTFVVSSPSLAKNRGAGAETVKNENLTYFAQTSADNGQTWQTAAIGLKKPAFKVDQSQFAAGETIQLRIVATNGLTNSIVNQESILIKKAK